MADRWLQLGRLARGDGQIRMPDEAAAVAKKHGHQIHEVGGLPRLNRPEADAAHFRFK